MTVRRVGLRRGWYLLCLVLWMQSCFHGISAQRLFGFAPTTASVREDRREDDYYAPRDRYTYVASLQHPYTGIHFCVGTLITKEWVLTSARCIDTKRFTTAVSNPVVAIGGESIVGPFKERHAIASIVVHPLYDGFVMGPYDLALLKLATPSQIQPLVAMHHGSPPILEGLETRGISWSRLETGGPYSKKLLEISGLKIIQEEDCFLRFGFPENISCLQVSMGDICAGGTGSPVVIPSFPDRLIGIALSSSVCNGDSKTTGFISIRHSREWILNTTSPLTDQEEFE